MSLIMVVPRSAVARSILPTQTGPQKMKRISPPSTSSASLCKIGREKQSQTSVVPRETAARERAADAQQQADTLVENRDAAQKLREIREAHGADSEAYQAERETVLRSMVNTASTENSGNKNKKHHHKHHHKKHHHKKHHRDKSSSNQNF